MAIHAPGIVRRRGLPRFDARASRKAAPSISMTSMIDVLVVLTVFLLLTFAPSDACGCIEKPVRLPTVDSGLEMIDAPIVSVAGRQIAVDGLPIDAGPLWDSGRYQRIDDLFVHLRSKHDLARQLERHAPRTVVLRIDVDVPAYVVKSVFQTSALAGYPDVSFMAEAR